MYKRSKIIFALFLLAALMFFTSDFQLIDIEKTAIVAAIGIDYVDESTLEVTAQVAVPQASDQTATNSDALLSAKGSTLFAALENISRETGWYPKLTFCNLIILGQSFVEHDFMPVVDYVLTSNRFLNSAVIATCEGSAREILSSPTPLDYVSSFALQKVLLRNLDRASAVLVADVREICALNRSRSSFFFMPLTKIVQAGDKPKWQTSSTGSYSTAINATPIAQGSGSGGKGGSESGQGGSECSKGGSQSSESGSTVFDATKTVLFTNGKIACEFTAEQTLCYNVMTKRARECFLPIIINKNGNDVNALISIIANDYKILINTDKGIPQITFSLDLICEKEETYLTENVKELFQTGSVSDEGLLALKNKLTDEITRLFNLSKDTDCDFFKIKELLYKKHYQKYAAFKDNILQIAKVKVEVNCKNRR